MTLLDKADDWLRDNCSRRLIKLYDASRLAAFAESVMPKWTYCEDAMPTEEGFYLVTALSGAVLRIYWVEDLGFDLIAKPIAWMPLPEPAK